MRTVQETEVPFHKGFCGFQPWFGYGFKRNIIKYGKENSEKFSFQIDKNISVCFYPFLFSSLYHELRLSLILGYVHHVSDLSKHWLLIFSS